MPIITDKREVASSKERQNACIKCNQSNRRILSLTVCDVCANWICKDCTEIDEKIYEYVTNNNINYNFICASCTRELPKIKDLLKISQKQIEIEDDIIKMKAAIEKNEKVQKDNHENLEERLSSVEKLLEVNKLTDKEYPALPAIHEKTKEIQKELTTQQETTTKLNTDMEEEKRKSAKLLNLIVYGLPESEKSIEDQMKTDFSIIQGLYSDRVELDVKDISNLTRLGVKKPNQIRPIRISFHDAQKRKEILVNNQELRLEHDSYKLCECKSNPGKHIHVNITNDKTKQEREYENKLREDLKERRSKGEDVIIKKGKIVKKSTLEAHPRWAVISQDGF